LRFRVGRKLAIEQPSGRQFIEIHGALFRARARPCFF
jgi:hypothetical protein